VKPPIPIPSITRHWLAVPVLVAIGLLSAGSVALASVAPEMVFARLGSNEGLAQGSVMAIAQDVQGFMWFGTEDGLDRFDGYELKHFINKRSVMGTLPNNWVAALVRDAAGRLWVGSDGGGVVRYDAESGQFQPPAGDSGQSLVDSNARVRALYVDRRGRIWAGTRSSGVNLLDMTTRTAQQYRRDPTSPNSLSDDSIYAFAEDPSGHMWIGTGSGLDRLDPDSGHIQQMGERLGAAGGPKDMTLKVNVLFVDARGVLWIGLESGLARFDASAAAFTLLQHHDGDADSLPVGRITAILEDDEQRLWVGTSAGLALLDRRTGRFAVARHDPSNPDSLPDNNIVSLYQDRTGMLWIGTKSGGLARWNPRSWSFGHHRFSEEDANNVTSFAVDHGGKLWVGSFGAGVASIDPRSGAVKRYSRESKSPLALHDDQVMALATDDRDRIWIGSMTKGIERLDPARREISRFLNVPNDAASLPAQGVMSLLRDSRGRMWVGTFGGGLARIDPDSDRVTRYPHGSDNPSGLLGDRATALAEDRAGLLWVGTDTGGLNVLDPVSGRFAHFMHDPKNPASLSANTVYSLHVDDKGRIWVGTRGGGLDRVIGNPFAKGGVRFENLSESEGLPNSTVYGIESDVTGTLWLSTNRGLASVHPQDRRVSGYRRSHGLQGDEFNFGAHFRAPDGTLYFGGSSGYNAFLPERLKFNDKPPEVVLTDVLKLNTRISQAPDQIRNIDLGFRDSVLTLRFAALDFTGPAENQYAYRLEGFDSNWVNSGNNRQATYTNLAQGSYVFKVRAANSDGRWSDARTTLRVRVAPQPWATWWARTLYGAGIGAIVFFVWFAQYRRVQREAAYSRRLKQEVDDRTAELAERNKDMERANHQLHEASVTDSLTHLGNRRLLHDRMATLLGPGANTTASTPAIHGVLMVVDLDMLKPINDKYGHTGGDAVLIQVAEILRGVFRSVDLIVRWGGDEFVVLCLNVDLATAAELAERVRWSVAKRIFRMGEGVAARTSCSIGFAAVPFIPGHPQLVGWEQSLSIADLSLYEAKRERNTWVGWGGTDKTAQLPSVLRAIATNAAGLEQDGFLAVRRRPCSAADTVDHLRAPHSP